MKRSKKFISILLLGMLIFSSISCGSEEEKTKDGYAKTIYLYNWSEYMPKKVLDKFEKEYGIKVVESTYESNDEMLAKLMQVKKGEYDIAVPSNFYVSALRENDLLEPLDKKKLSNLGNIDKAYMGLDYDKTNKYCVPYLGTVCPWIGNKKLLSNLGVTVNSFKDISNGKLKGNIVMTDDPQGNISQGLIALGYDAASNDLGEIKEAKNYLLSINNNVKSYSVSSDARDIMAKGEAAVGYMYGGNAVQAMNENSDLEVIMNNEKTSLSTDNFVILKGTKHKKEAELFINFILRPDISAEISEEYPYVCLNKEAVNKLPEDLKNNPLVVLTDDMKQRLYLINNFDADAMNAEVNAMTEVKSAR